MLGDVLTGVTVTPVDDVSFQLFAPNADAMDEAREMIEEFLTDEVNGKCLLFSISVQGG